ncbi:hypothetical protein [Alteromonas sp. a30]|uniref:hypothetical protein n=1 Tax=Alteromonas sp. a30 TaxID=2730917 RepID=UPI002280D075|nr:hypothetical protein [Alteromonas sp. a30]MCY7294752.1 hypothetical protein [Alteromonas sp. a30]
MSNLYERNWGLKSHIYFNKVDEGVYFQGQAGGFIIKGDVYPLISRIISFIDAGFPLTDIRAQLPENVRPFLDNLVSQFAQNGMLVERGTESLAPESWLEHKPFQDFFSYLRDNAEGFAEKYPLWQQQNAVAVGDGYALKAAIESLALSGLKQLSVMVTNSETVALSEIKNTLEHYVSRLPGFQYTLSEELAPAKAALTQYDCVIQCMSVLDEETPLLVGQQGVVAGVLFGQGVVSPVAGISTSGYQDLVEQVTRAMDATEAVFPKSGVAMLGSLAALNTIKGFFGIELAGIRNYVYRVSRYLGVSRHPLFPVNTGEDGAQLMEAFQAEFEMPDDRELEKYEQVKLDLSAFFDPLLGCFNEAVGDTVKQVPLFHSKLEVRFPHSAQLPSQSVLSCGLDASTAGLRAISEAISLRSSKGLGVAATQVCTAFDLDEWQRKAAAYAIARSDAFKSEAKACRINMKFLEDEEMQLIFRFLLSAGYQADALVLYWHDAGQAFVAQLPSVSGASVVSCIGATAFDAIQSCLCAAYVKLQFPDIIGSNAGHELVMTQEAVDDAFGQQLQALMSLAPTSLPDLTFVQGEPLLASYDIYSGYSELKEVS